MGMLISKPCQRRLDLITQGYTVEKADIYANLIGRSTPSIRGNGPLFLMADQLWFSLLVPKHTFVIPVTDITRIEISKSYKSRSVGHPLLILTAKNVKLYKNMTSATVHEGYTTLEGEETFAFFVQNPQEWNLLLDKKSQK